MSLERLYSVFMRLWNLKNYTFYSSWDVAIFLKGVSVVDSCLPYDISEIFFLEDELFLAHNPLYSMQVLTVVYINLQLQT